MGPRRPECGEREELQLPLQPQADIFSYREEKCQQCHPELAAPSILSFQGRWEGLAISRDISLKSEGHESSGSFLIEY